ncbi:MAG: ABC transporter ATP-binding protein [Chloroflexota bacterium]
MATVTFDHVNKVYGDFHAVHDLNLEIGDGEFMVLVGPSGCGKTTSLRMIAGLEEITDGELRIGDRVVNDVPPKDRDIAMVFQSYALYPHMTVRDNLAFGLKLRKVPKPEIERRVKEAAETIQLQNLLDRKPKELSGGQRQRVALGRAIVREPAVFLMDEPLSNLDAKLRVQTRAEIARLHQRLKTTVVYVTHDQVEAMTMGSRIAVMSEGLLQQVGTPQTLYDTPINRFVAGFIGSPSMNFVDVTVDGDRLVGPSDWSIPIPPQHRGSSSSGRKLVVGFRPEHLEVGQAGSDSGGFQARADVVEYLGNEELLHVSAAGQDIVAIVGSEHRVRPGDIVDLVIPLSKVHLFDSETQGSLAAGAAAVPPPSTGADHAAAGAPSAAAVGESAEVGMAAASTAGAPSLAGVAAAPVAAEMVSETGPGDGTASDDDTA